MTGALTASEGRSIHPGKLALHVCQDDTVTCRRNRWERATSAQVDGIPTATSSFKTLNALRVHQGVKWAQIETNAWNAQAGTTTRAWQNTTIVFNALGKQGAAGLFSVQSARGGRLSRTETMNVRTYFAQKAAQHFQAASARKTSTVFLLVFQIQQRPTLF